MGKSSNFLLFFFFVFWISACQLWIWFERKEINVQTSLKTQKSVCILSCLSHCPFPRALLVLESLVARNQGYKTWWEGFQSNLMRVDLVLSCAVNSAYIHALELQLKTYKTQEGGMQVYTCRWAKLCLWHWTCDFHWTSVTEGNRTEAKTNNKIIVA